MTLSERLRTVASAVPFGSRFADVGTDHALLPIYLFEQGRISFAIATDIAKGPCEAARSNVSRHGLSNNISVRMGNGLESVRTGEVDTIAIAGMGGHTAREILEGSPDVVRCLKRIIVQPMNASHHVRQFFLERGFVIADEQVIQEEGRFYEIVVADASKETDETDPVYQEFLNDPVWRSLALDFGPTLLLSPTEPFMQYLGETLRAWGYVMTQLSKSTTTESRDRVKALTEKLDRLSRWMKNTRADKTM